jgi:cation:H+ antiporter
MQNLLLLSFAAPQMWLQIVLFVAGIAVVLWGADRLTDGAVGLAARMGMSQLVIGLTIVAMGTSMPEFFVSLMSAIHGTPDLAVGNIVGSNIFNALFIVGCAAMVAPIAIVSGTVKKDIPFAIIASVVLLMLCLDSRISRIDAAILFVLFVYFMYATLHITKQEQPAAETSQEEERLTMSMGKSLLLIIVGLTCLVFGSSVFVDNASAIASSLGMSDALIGLTIVAGGTSLPELATSVVAARRGNSGIAIGNVVGSNVFNILMILGVTGLITPMHIAGISYTDLSVMVGSMILLWLFSFTKYRIERWEGAALVLSFAGYMTYLISQAV